MKNNKSSSIQYWRRIDLVSREKGRLLMRPVRHLDVQQVPEAMKELLSCSGSAYNGIFIPNLANLLALLLFRPSLLSRMSSLTPNTVTWIEIRNCRLVLRPESSELQLLINDKSMMNIVNVPRV